jgi:hypothetical protein
MRRIRCSNCSGWGCKFQHKIAYDEGVVMCSPLRLESEAYLRLGDRSDEHRVNKPSYSSRRHGQYVPRGTETRCLHRMPLLEIDASNDHIIGTSPCRNATKVCAVWTERRYLVIELRGFADVNSSAFLAVAPNQRSGEII